MYLQTCWFNPYRLRVSQAGDKPDFEIGDLNEVLEILDCYGYNANCKVL